MSYEYPQAVPRSVCLCPGLLCIILGEDDVAATHFAFDDRHTRTSYLAFVFLFLLLLFRSLLRSHESRKLRLKLFPVRQIELIPADKDLIGNALQGVLHDQLVPISAEHDPDGFSITIGIHFLSVIVQVEIHLPDVLMLDLTTLQIYQHEALEDAMVEHEVYFIGSPTNRHALLPPDIGEALPQFQQKLAEIVDQSFLQIPPPCRRAAVEVR